MMNTAVSNQSSTYLKVHAPETPAEETYSDAQREALILEHMPMVPKIVGKTLKNIKGSHDIDEFISAGNLGLVQAAHSFDPNVGTNFGAYAYCRIRGAVLDELRRKCFLPISVYRQLRRLQRVQFALRNELGREPSDEELARAANISRENMGDVLSVMGKGH